ncbi:MAG: hypothetical protein IPP77_05355 [Bacteroidetes bacterium]|nr:hypothetical protein [Bacteroidota bacterium]
MYLDRASNTTNVGNYVTGLFNVVQALYSAESIDVQISSIYVWTSTDPYINYSTSPTIINAFSNYRTSYSGTFAHLLSTRSINIGGIAGPLSYVVNGFCYKNFSYAYSNIFNIYTSSSPPVYSWTIQVVSHELGHNMGSPHTHSCSWAGGAIDNCYTPEGQCNRGPSPSNGGTIMSYCHLSPNPGINFSNGFGTQPGNLIRNNYNSASCLTSCGGGGGQLNCSNAIPVNCGTVLTNQTTVGGANNANSYACIPSWNESGPEKVYVINTTTTGKIRAELLNANGNLDVFILSSCNNNSGNCEYEVPATEYAELANAPPGVYYIVVDGYNGYSGAYSLKIDCQCQCQPAGSKNPSSTLTLP